MTKKDNKTDEFDMGLGFEKFNTNNNRKNDIDDFDFNNVNNNKNEEGKEDDFNFNFDKGNSNPKMSA